MPPAPGNPLLLGAEPAGGVVRKRAPRREPAAR
jgi:hypothetical protein